MTNERDTLTAKELVKLLNLIETRKCTEKKNIREPDIVTLCPGRKYDKINIGGSGAWMIERATGEIYNIKGYGVPDKNKKQKADIGNLNNVDPENMHARRWNYLR